jgi:hypothetical protein
MTIFHAICIEYTQHISVSRNSFLIKGCTMWQCTWGEHIHILPVISLHPTYETFLPVICNCERTRRNNGHAYDGRFACTPFTNVARSRVPSVSTIAAIPARPSACGTWNNNRHTLCMSLFVTTCHKLSHIIIFSFLRSSGIPHTAY